VSPPRFPGLVSSPGSQDVLHLLCHLLTSLMGSGSIALSSANSPRTRRSRAAQEISQGKIRNFRCINAGFIKHTPLRMEDFAVTCPLVPSVPHLISGSCSSPCIFELSFLQTPPRDDALALLLTFGSAKTWYRDSHPVSYVPCLAHTFEFTCRKEKERV
jgi:hypothetical protein